MSKQFSSAKKTGAVSGYYSKQFKSSLTIKNNETIKIEMMIDIIMSTILMSIQYQGELYQTSESLLTESDIVNIVNQQPELIDQSQQLSAKVFLKFDNFPLITLSKTTQQEINEIKFKLKKDDTNQDQNSAAKFGRQQNIDFDLKDIYAETEKYFSEQIKIKIEQCEKRLEEIVNEIAEFEKKIEEQESKKDKKDEEPLKFYQTSIEILQMEQEKLGEITDLFKVSMNSTEQRTQNFILKKQIFWIKLDFLQFQYHEMKSKLETQFNAEAEELRKARIRKNNKDYDSHEKICKQIYEEFIKIKQCQLFCNSDIHSFETFLQQDECLAYQDQIFKLNEEVVQNKRSSQELQEQLSEKQKEYLDLRKQFNEYEEQSKQQLHNYNNLQQEVEQRREEAENIDS